MDKLRTQIGRIPVNLATVAFLVWLSGCQGSSPGGNQGPNPPTITSQPVNQTVVAGQTATFSVVAAGTAPLTYQWTKNGANISGATSASYATPATTTADNNSTFQVTVSNAAGSILSAKATLTVTPGSGSAGATLVQHVSGSQHPQQQLCQPVLLPLPASQSDDSWQRLGGEFHLQEYPHTFGLRRQG